MYHTSMLSKLCTRTVQFYSKMLNPKPEALAVLSRVLQQFSWLGYKASNGASKSQLKDF